MIRHAKRRTAINRSFVPLLMTEARGHDLLPFGNLGLEESFKILRRTTHYIATELRDPFLDLRYL